MLENIKLLLGIDNEDTSKDSLLLLLIDTTTSRLTLLLGGISPPKNMEHIIMEVAVIRFNRIGSEGLSSHSVEGETLSYSDDDFSGFMSEIQAFLDTQKESTHGKVRFL